jgi:hypothetical protein
MIVGQAVVPISEIPVINDVNFEPPCEFARSDRVYIS